MKTKVSLTILICTMSAAGALAQDGIRRASNGVEVDVNLHPGAQLALLYSRQDSDLTYKSGGIKNDLSDISVEYFQIGGIGGARQGKTMPFGMVTLGATRFAFKDIRAADDLWKVRLIEEDFHRLMFEMDGL